MKHQLISLALVAVFSCCAPLALAHAGSAATPIAAASSTQAAHAMQQQQMQRRERMHLRSHQMMGRHMMPSTVDSVDHTTGIVEVTTAGMHLRVHFPPPTITGLKAGDKINVMLAYRMQAEPKAATPAVEK